jgi:hypothetical protein
MISFFTTLWSDLVTLHRVSPVIPVSKSTHIFPETVAERAAPFIPKPIKMAPPKVALLTLEMDDFRGASQPPPPPPPLIAGSFESFDDDPSKNFLLAFPRLDENSFLSIEDTDNSPFESCFHADVPDLGEIFVNFFDSPF